jgi:hypothetical protein
MLEKAYADRSMLLTFLTVDHEFDSLHSVPRFRDLARNVGLFTVNPTGANSDVPKGATAVSDPDIPILKEAKAEYAKLQ